MKPIIVEAVRFEGTNVPEVELLVGDDLWMSEHVLKNGATVEDLVIHNGSSEQIVPVGHWVVRNVDGSFSAVDPVAFHAQFEKTEAMV